jgi:hypothetical protein
MNAYATPPVAAPAPPRVNRGAEAVIAQYIHELFERHAEEARERTATEAS